MKIVLLTCVAMVAGSAALQADVPVTPSNMGDWTFTFLDGSANSCANCQIGSMVTGPGVPPLGVGSANLQTTPGNGDGAASIAYGGINGIALGSLTALSYSTYDTSNNGQQFPYLELHISYTNDLNNDGHGTDSLFFEPPYQTPATGDPSLPSQGDTVMNQWQTWNALAGGWWDNNGVANPGSGVLPFSTFLAFYTDPVIIGSSYFANDGLNLTVGFASSTDNFNGNVDNVTIGVNGANTTYNFDPNTSAVPEPASLLLLGTLVVGIGAGMRRAKRFRA